MLKQRTVFWGGLSVLFFLGPVVFGAEARIGVDPSGQGAAVELIGDADQGCFARLGPFAADQLRREEDGTVLITADAVTTAVAPPAAGSPFFTLTFSTRPCDDTVLREFQSPAAAVTISSAAGPIGADALKALGTAGLTAVDGHPGSYAFLAIADPENNRGVVAGWETSHVGSGVLFSEKTAENAVSLRAKIEYGAKPLKAGESFTSEKLLLGAFDDVRLGLEAYAEKVAAANGVTMKPPRTGFCTWYCDKNGGCASEEAVAVFARRAGEKLVPYGLDYFQIDDQWQRGDSRRLSGGPDKNFSDVRPDGGYPSGIKKTADTLAEAGLTCGLWILPFNGDAKDPWFADKMDLFVKSAIDYPPPGQKNDRLFAVDEVKGAPYEAFWAGTCLDMTRPETVDYVAGNIRRMVDQWGVGFIKTDGLWCGMAIEELYVNDGYHPDDIGNQIFFDSSKTNVEAFHAGMTVLRQSAGDAFVLGCCVPQNMRMMLASAGFVDAMRIGPDNGASWEGIRSGPRRASNRYFFNGRVWWNDPDPVYARDSIPLNHSRTIASWAALAGQLYAFSDWLPDLSDERVNVLRRTIPGHGRKTVRPIDLLTCDLAQIWTLSNAEEGRLPEDTRFVCGFFNWDENQPAGYELTPEKLEIAAVSSEGKPAVDYVLYDYWNETFLDAYDKADGKVKIDVPAADCRIIAVRPVFDPKRPILVSTSRNVNQGIYEVLAEEWDGENRTMTITVDPKKAALAEELPYELRFYHPEGTVPEAKCGDVDLPVNTFGPGRFSITVNPDRTRFADSIDPVRVILTFPEP